MQTDLKRLLSSWCKFCQTHVPFTWKKTYHVTISHMALQLCFRKINFILIIQPDNNSTHDFNYELTHSR